MCVVYCRSLLEDHYVRMCNRLFRGEKNKNICLVRSWKNSSRTAKKNRCIRSLNASAPESLQSSALSSGPWNSMHELEDHAGGDFFLDPAIFEQLVPKRGRPAGAKDMKPRKKRKPAAIVHVGRRSLHPSGTPVLVGHFYFYGMSLLLLW